ncbi:glycosyltransferase family 4 protein [Candidatus Bathyarchaeota archaeon]|nr:glycosyltransferase family 4 protein [Candidatus Bathyarchaeota archaeon]
MRIAFFVWEYYPRLVGGLGTYAIEITCKFVELGHEVVVFTLNPGDLLTHELWNGIMIHRPMIVDTYDVFPIVVTEDLRRWGTNIKFFCDVFSYNHLSASKFVNELVKKVGESYDLVAVHDWLSAPAGLMIAKEMKDKIPVVFHLHSTEEQRSGGVGSEVVRHFERAMAEKATRVVTVSYAMRDHLISLGYPVDKIRVCWNGCSPEKYDPAKVDSKNLEIIKASYKLESDEKVILFIGRLTWVKGIQNLIQAMPIILTEFPKTKLVILGKGEEYQDLVQLTQRLNIVDKVIFRSEWVSEEERILHYAMADVCVFPSLSEPFGIVSLEAMSMERPVVVGARGLSGFREQVVPSGQAQCGIHVNGEDPADIAWGVKEVLKDATRAKRWGENGRKRVLEYFTWDKAARNTLAIYEELIRR